MVSYCLVFCESCICLFVVERSVRVNDGDGGGDGGMLFMWFCMILIEIMYCYRIIKV